MSVNRRQPHVFVLPEDDANRQIAKGFHLDLQLSTCKFQVLDPVGGWIRVLECFLSDHVTGMDRFPTRLMVLMIDFDRREDRLQYAKARIPVHLTDRVSARGVNRKT